MKDQEIRSLPNPTSRQYPAHGARASFHLHAAAADQLAVPQLAQVRTSLWPAAMTFYLQFSTSQEVPSRRNVPGVMQDRR